jgi:hypothetical protein
MVRCNKLYICQTQFKKWIKFVGGVDIGEIILIYLRWFYQISREEKTTEKDAAKTVSKRVGFFNPLKLIKF